MSPFSWAGSQRNWNTQGESSSSQTDELVSTAVTELPAWADVDTSPQGPVILS